MAPPRKILRQQLEILIDFLEANKDMSKGLPPGPPIAHQVTRQKWSVLAKKLNGVPSGVLKPPDRWKKYWFEWRHKCRKKAANAKRLQSTTTPSRFVPLNDLEIRVLELNGDGTVNATTSSTEQLDSFLNDDSESELKMQEDFPLHIKTGQESKFKSSSERERRSVTPPPKWALQLEERRLAAEERSALALESMAAIMKSQEERRGMLEERISDAITAIAGSMQDINNGLQEVMQYLHHSQVPRTNEHPIKEVVFL